MRKNKDGYVLIYVVFVIIFLCIVAAGTCTVALNNIRVQTAYIEQMQNRYEAEGAIEKFMAEVCVGEAVSHTGLEKDYTLNRAKALFLSQIIDLARANEIALSEVESELEGELIKWGGQSCSVRLHSNTAKITASVEFIVTIDQITNYRTETDPETGEQREVFDSYTATIKANTSKYLSYNLESTGGDAE